MLQAKPANPCPTKLASLRLRPCSEVHGLLNQAPCVAAVSRAQDTGAIVGIENVVGVAGAGKDDAGPARLHRESPMLMEASEAPPSAASVSVSGVKTMEDDVEIPALLATQTPPPVVPA